MAIIVANVRIASKAETRGCVRPSIISLKKDVEKTVEILRRHIQSGVEHILAQNRLF